MKKQSKLVCNSTQTINPTSAAALSGVLAITGRYIPMHDESNYSNDTDGDALSATSIFSNGFGDEHIRIRLEIKEDADLRIVVRQLKKTIEWMEATSSIQEMMGNMPAFEQHVSGNQMWGKSE
jgi:hypothetical protein